MLIHAKNFQKFMTDTSVDESGVTSQVQLA